MPIMRSDGEIFLAGFDEEPNSIGEKTETVSLLFMVWHY